MLPPRLQRDFRVALAHVNGGDLQAAATACARLRRAAPDDPAVLQLHATVALRRDAPAEALASIRRSLDGRPGHVPSLILAAQAAYAVGLPGEAMAPLHEAIARVPDLAEPVFLLCRFLLEAGDSSLGAALAAAADRHPGAAAEWQQLGLALQRAAKPAEAMAAFTRAATADPELAAAHFGCGLLLRDAGRMTEAKAALQRTVALDPTAAAAWFALGLTCQDLDDEAAAAAAFQQALHQRPGFAEAAVNLGIARQHLGDMEAAIEAWRAAVRIRPDTFGRIAQAVTSARTGMLCLDPAAFRRRLGA